MPRSVARERRDHFRGANPIATRRYFVWATLEGSTVRVTRFSAHGTRVVTAATP
jgi:hypothetical protein